MPTTKNDEYRWVGNHPQDFFGNMVESGAFLTFTKEQLEDEQLKDLLDRGLLIKAAGGND